MTYGENRLTLEEIEKDVVVLIGPNGSGKSQSLKVLKEILQEKDNTTVIHFASKEHDSLKRAGSPLANLSTDMLAMSLQSGFVSEGERINNSFDIYFMSEVLPRLHQNKETDFWFLVDEFDSGLSLDKMQFILSSLFTIKKMEKNRNNRDLNYIFTANSYELVSTIQTLYPSVQIYNIDKKKNVEISSYEDFKNLYQERYHYLKEER